MPELKATTTFVNDAIRIDPSGCGCMDCFTGDSIPEDSPLMQELLDSAINEGRELIHLGDCQWVLYRNRYGHGEIMGLYDGAREYEVLEEDNGSMWDEEENKKVLSLRLPYREYTNYEDSEFLILEDDNAECTRILDEKIAAGYRLANETGAVLVYAKTYMDTYTFYEVETDDPESITFQQGL